jgi:hypothetical protein
MKRTMLSSIAFTLVVATVAGTSGCMVDDPDVAYDGNVGVGVGVYGDYPPDAYIATTEPFYYNGYPSYWYGGRWYFRGGDGRWGHYNHEPSGLYSRRMQSAPARHVYEPARSMNRGGGGGMGRSGGRGGRR